MTLIGTLAFCSASLFVAVFILVTALALRRVYPPAVMQFKETSTLDTKKYLTNEDKAWLNSMQVPVAETPAPDNDEGESVKGD